MRNLTIVNRCLGNFIGGGENFALQIAEALLERKFQVTIITGAGCNEKILMDKYPKIKFVFLDAPYFRNPEFGFRKGSVLSKIANTIALELDLLVFDFFVVGRIKEFVNNKYVLSCGLFRIGALLSILGKKVVIRLPGPVNLIKYILTLDFVATLTCVKICANGHAYTKTKLGRKIQYLDIAYPHYTAINENSGLYKRSIDYLWVGRLETIKGADKIPEVVTEIIKNSPSEPKIVIIGGGSLKSKITEFFKDHRNVEVKGECSKSDVLNAFRESKVVFMLSRYDNWPNVIFEAMGNGCAVVAPAVGGIPKIAARYQYVATFDCDANAFEVAQMTINQFKKSNPIQIQNSYKKFLRSWGNVADEMFEIMGGKNDPCIY